MSQMSRFYVLTFLYSFANVFTLTPMVWFVCW